MPWLPTRREVTRFLAGAPLALLARRALGQRAFNDWAECPVVVGATRKRWSNYAGNQHGAPLQILDPGSLEELICIVRKATENLEKPVPVKAVGSSHAWSDVAVTDGYLVNTHRLSRILDLDPGELRSDAHPETLVYAEGGITIRALNKYLDCCRQLALANMGGYDGQTIAGATSTATHGSGIAFGPLCDFIESLELVAADQSVYRVEPTNGITDPSRFQSGRSRGVKLIQDDDVFDAARVGIGCMGIIYALILRVVPSFNLEEVRTLTTWEEEKDRIPEQLKKHRHYELLLNPYDYPKKGCHGCLVTTRNCTTEPITDETSSRNVLIELASQLPFIDRVLALFGYVGHRYTDKFLYETLGRLVEPEDHPYRNKSYRVFNIGASNDIIALSAEIALPMKGDMFIRGIERFMEVAQEDYELGKVRHLGTVSVRFVKGTTALLAPQHGCDTCMLELFMPVKTYGAAEMLRRYEVALYPFHGRPHWGQYNMISAEVSDRLYAETIKKWRDIRGRVFGAGLFDNPFAWRAGLVDPSGVPDTACKDTNTLSPLQCPPAPPP